MIKNIYEIWTIREDLSTLTTHKTFDEADLFNHPEAFQTLYRLGEMSPIHVYKSYK